MLRRRLAASAGVLSLLTCAATIVLVCIARERVAQTQLTVDGRLRGISHRIDQVERESKAYEEKIGSRPSLAERMHSIALDSEINRLLTEQNKYAQHLLWPPAGHGALRGLIDLATLSLAALVAFAIFTPALSRDFRRELAARALCPACGYDLRATPARCPECGWRAAATSTG